MATVQDIEIRDSAARTAQAVEEAQDIHGEKMVLNMGPSRAGKLRANIPNVQN